jgi:RES domain-containing protein
LSQLTTEYQTGIVFRFVSIKHWQTPLSAVGSLKNGGRYNIGQDADPDHAFSALYTSDSPITALKEIKILLNPSIGTVAYKGNPSVLFSIEYRLSSVLDLTLHQNQDALRTNFQELTGIWLPQLFRNTTAPTQELGLISNEIQVEALKVPSSLDPSAFNLVIFPEQLKKSSLVKIYDDTQTIADQLP